MVKNDATFFIGFFVLLFVLWLVTGGPSRPLSWAGPFLNAPAPLGSGKAYFLSGAGFGSSSTTGLAGFTIGTAGNNVSVSNRNSASNAAYFTNASPYRDVVYFNSSPSSAEEKQPDTEYVSVTVSANATKPIDITGWQIVSGNTRAVIPQGAVIPVTGSINQVGDIVLRGGDTAIFGSGYSPIGVSFRENICTGYLAQFQRYTPSLQESCPSPGAYFNSLYGFRATQSQQECQSFVNSIGSCEIVTDFPSNNDYNSIDRSCRDFVSQHFTYNGCVADHQADQNFAGKTWHVYLRGNVELWRNDHDAVRLLDVQGRTVDVLVY